MNCPACGVANPQVFYEVRNVPTTSNLLMKSREEALNWPRGDATLARCQFCDFIFNTSFDQTLLREGRYEASQACSLTFGKFARELAADWIARYGLRGKHVMEIGSGDGSFLKMMCAQAGGNGLGIDPLARVDQSTENVRFIAESFHDKHLDNRPAFVFCRHTLEHIPKVKEFLQSLAGGLCARNSPAIVAIEVPDTLRVLNEAAFWDIYYEHCSYFTGDSLRRVLDVAGFTVLRQQLVYGGQYLVIEAKPGVGSWNHSSIDTRAFQENVRASLDEWRRVVRESKSCVVWGAGSKAVGFLMTLGVGDEVKAVVDINPAKQNSFLPGTGHEIVAPDRLREIQPDRVIVMNPVYAKEIEASLLSMGLRPEVSLLS